jgi:hypothetical protein
VEGSRYWTRLWWLSWTSSSARTPVAQYFDGGPGPERAVFFGGQVAAFAGGQVFGPDAGGAAGGAGQGLPGGGDDVAGPGGAGRLQQGGRVGVLPGGAADQDRQDGEPFAGAGVHP